MQQHRSSDSKQKKGRLSISKADLAWGGGGGGGGLLPFYHSCRKETGKRAVCAANRNTDTKVSHSTTCNSVVDSFQYCLKVALTARPLAWYTHALVRVSK